MEVDTRLGEVRERLRTHVAAHPRIVVTSSEKERALPNSAPRSPRWPIRQHWGINRGRTEQRPLAEGERKRMPDTTNRDETKLERARILSEALPFMQRYDKRTVVVKYGGHAMGDETLGAEFARDIVMLKQAGLNPIVVHGGGPQIGAMLTRLGIKSEFSGGLRITDRATVEIVEMVLGRARSTNRSSPSSTRREAAPSAFAARTAT